MSAPADRILVISSIGCGPPYHGNRARMRSLIAECRRLGFKVDFAGVELTEEERSATEGHVDRWIGDFHAREGLLSRIRSRALRTLQKTKAPTETASLDRWFRPHWFPQAKQLARRYAHPIVLVPYVFHSAFLLAFPRAKVRILDTHDCFSDRNARLSAAGLPPTSEWFSVSRDEEAIGLARASAVLAIQRHEAAYFANILSGKAAVHVVGHFTRTSPPPSERPPEELVGFIGSSNDINVASLKRFLADVWPLVSSRRPSLRLAVAGDVAGAVALPATATAIGRVGDPADFYSRCLLTVNPMVAGTGLKIKTVESMAHGRPVVASPCGAEGLEQFRGKGLTVARDDHEFAEAVVDFSTTPDWKVICRMALGCVEEMNEESRRSLEHALRPGDVR